MKPLLILTVLALSAVLSAQDLIWSATSYKDATSPILAIHSNLPGKCRVSPIGLSIDVVADGKGGYYVEGRIPAITRTYQLHMRGSEIWLHVTY